MVRRSLLFSPGDQPSLLRKAPESGADVVTFDLEDAVHPDEKAEARETITSVLPSIDAECELCVRINPLDAGGKEDVEELVTVGDSLDSIMLSKVAESADVRKLRELLASHGSRLPILALLETAGGILNAAAIADEGDVDGLLMGAEDLAAEIGARRTDAGEEVSYARQRVVLAASNAGIDAIDTIVTDFEDTEQLEADTERAIQYGYDGKMAIHPAQVSVINDKFTPDAEQREWAQKVLSATEKAEQEGKGVFAVDGEMIDAPLIAQAERIQRRARAAGVLEETDSK